MPTQQVKIYQYQQPSSEQKRVTNWADKHMEVSSWKRQRMENIGPRNLYLIIELPVQTLWHIFQQKGDIKTKRNQKGLNF